METVYKYDLVITSSVLPEDTVIDGCGTLYAQDNEEVSQFGSRYIHKVPTGAFVLEGNVVTLYSSCDMGENVLCCYDTNIDYSDNGRWWKGVRTKIITELSIVSTIPTDKKGFLGSASKKLPKGIEL